MPGDPSEAVAQRSAARAAWPIARFALDDVRRASGDIDLFVRATSDNAERVFTALARFGAPLEAAGISAADFARPALVYQIGLPPRRIDVLTEISGVSFAEVWESRLTV